MTRAMLAIATLLLSALFLHNLWPHPGVANVVSVERTTERIELETDSVDADPTRAPERTPGRDIEQIALPTSGQQTAAPAAVALDKAIAVVSEQPAAAAHAQQARDRRTRSITRPPSPVALQICRC